MIRTILFTTGLMALSLLAVPVVTPLVANAATFGDGSDNPLVADDDCTAPFLTFPAWYDGLPREGCIIQTPDVDKNGGGLPAFIFRIVLNVIEMALQIVAYAAVGFIIYGGFKYLTSAGSPDRITAGRKIITNAIIGLVISMLSVVIVTLIAGNIKI